MLLIAGAVPASRRGWSDDETRLFKLLTCRTTLGCRVENVIDEDERRIDVSLYGDSGKIEIKLKMFGPML
jgi:hypothetical protein